MNTFLIYEIAMRTNEHVNFELIFGTEPFCWIVHRRIKPCFLRLATLMHACFQFWSFKWPLFEQERKMRGSGVCSLYIYRTNDLHDLLILKNLLFCRRIRELPALRTPAGLLRDSRLRLLLQSVQDRSGKDRKYIRLRVWLDAQIEQHGLFSPLGDQIFEDRIFGE